MPVWGFLYGLVALTPPLLFLQHSPTATSFYVVQTPRLRKQFGHQVALISCKGKRTHQQTRKEKEMEYSDILENLNKVFRITQEGQQLPGRVEKHIGQGRWRVYDFIIKDYVLVRTKDIQGLWEGELPEDASPIEPSAPATNAAPTKANDTARKKNEGKSDAADLGKESDMPGDEWSMQRLKRYAQEQNNRIEHYDHQTAIHVRRLGHALEILLPRMKRGEREDWLAANEISTSKSSRSRRLYRATKESEKLLDGLGIMEAYYKFGILRKPDADEEPSDAKTGEEPKKAAKKKGEEKQEGQQPRPPKEQHDLRWFLENTLVGIATYADEPLAQADKDECLRLVAELQEKCKELQNRLGGTHRNA